MLTGFMGTGKSTAGRRLAGLLGYEWIDTDHLIEQRHGPIEAIFARAGESVFRGIERNIVTEVSTRLRCVISTGGKMLLDRDNVRAVSAHGRIFCLRVDPDVLVGRLIDSPTPRPLLATPNPEQRIRDLLAERQLGYSRFTQVEASDGSPDALASRLAELVSAPTSVPAGRRGHAVLGDAPTGLVSPVVVVSDPQVTELHGPCLGPVSATVHTLDAARGAGSLIFLGGTSVTALCDPAPTLPTVVAPTTRRAMDRDYPAGVRVVSELATLQTGSGAS